MTTAEMIEVMQAYEIGEQIEWRIKNGNKEWMTKQKPPLWDWNNFEYRVGKRKPTYRPYNNAEEFLNAQKEHGIYMVEKNKIDEMPSKYEIPTTVGEEFVTFVLPCTCNGNDMHSVTYNYENLLKYKVWQDKTPCGILE